jgi:hypothetical protein
MYQLKENGRGGEKTVVLKKKVYFKYKYKRKWEEQEVQS